MKYFITSLLLISLGFNVFFIVRKLNLIKEDRENMKVHFVKDISHKDGYQFFKNEIKKNHPEIEVDKKLNLICFWDSSGFDHKTRTLKSLDSLAGTFGKYSFNYIFATELEENAANQYLSREEVKFDNFKIIGGVDDFISGVYNEKPVKWKFFGPKPDSSKKRTDNCPDPRKMKIKPYYLLMDEKGKILYYNYKFFLPEKDTAFMNLIIKLIPKNNIKLIN